MKITGIQKSELETILVKFEKFANTFFWTPPSNASERRSEESENSFCNKFKVDGKEVVAEIKVSCSCKKYYSTRSITVNGESKRMMIPYLKKLIKEGEFE